MKNMNLHEKFEKFEQVKMRQAAALISQNIGFSTASTSAISSLSYLLRIYFERLCRDSTECASHVTELHDYIRQVNSFSLPEELPLFPVPANLLDENDGALTINEAENSNEKLLATAEIENGGDHQQQQETNNDLDQRVNQRIVQKTFPSFTGSFAPDLGFTVRRIIPPTVEISTNLDFTKNHVQCDAFFKIVKHDSAVVPTFSAKAVPQDERHKEKKRKKKEKRKQKEELKKEKELMKQNDGNREELEEARQVKGNQVQEPTAPELEQPLKIPKIKIRIGPSPEPLIAHTTVDPLSTAVNQTAQTAKISAETLPNPQIFEKDELLSKSMPIQTDEKHLPILQDQIKSLSHPAQTQVPLLVPPLRIKSPEKSIPQKKIPIDEANTSKAFEHENRIFTQQMQTEREEPPINNSESDGQSQTTLPISSKDLAKSSGKKRSRKSEKPSRVDPEMLASLEMESSPPQIPAAPSRAMESVLRKSMTPTPAISEQPDKIEIQLKTKTVHEEEPKIASLTAEVAPKKVKPKSKTATKKAQANSVPVSSKTPSAEQQGSAAEEEQEEDIWICPVCSVAYVDNGPDMVACDGCDRWFHWGCVGILIPPPENAPWFCTECKKKRKKQQGTGGGSNGNGGNTSRKSSFGGPPTKKRKPSK